MHTYVRDDVTGTKHTLASTGLPGQQHDEKPDEHDVAAIDRIILHVQELYQLLLRV
jgi:hypothetical protein